MKEIKILFFLGLFCTPVFGQYSIDNFPKNNHLYQRDTQDSAAIQIKGMVTALNNVLHVKILKDNVLYAEKYYSTIQSFDYKPKLLAGRFVYKIQLFRSINGGAETLEREANYVVVGDAFMIYGQSNAYGYFIDRPEYPTDPFIRIYNYNNDARTGDFVKLADNPSHKHIVGVFPCTFAEELAKLSPYPIGLFQGAQPGAEIQALNQTANQNPRGNSQFYDRMMLQIESAGLKNTFKYVIFRQGESDAISFLEPHYPGRFQALIQLLRADLPSFTKFYNAQLNLVSTAYIGGPDRGIERLREFQRQSENLYPEVVSVASVGNAPFDGLHYNYESHQQFSIKLAALVHKQIVQPSADFNRTFPNLKRAYFNESKTKVILSFDDRFSFDPALSKYWNGAWHALRDQFYFDETQVLANNLNIFNHRVVLYMMPNSNPLKVTYLWPYSTPSLIYDGPILKTTQNAAALTFANVPIQQPFQISNAQVQLITDLQALLSWTFQPGTTYYVEKSLNNTTWQLIGKSTSATFIDTGLGINQTYYYRVYAENASSGSDYTSVLTLNTACPQLSLVTTPSNFATLNTKNGIAVEGTLNINAHYTNTQYLEFRPGFQTTEGTVFRAEVAGCN